MSQYLAWGQCFWFFWFFKVSRGTTKKTKKKQKGRTYVPVSGMGSVLLVFLFFLVSRGKTKKTKRQNLCPSIWHGVSTFGFFCFFWFLEVKQKKSRTYVPVSGMGSLLLSFLAFWFFEVFAIFWYLTWVLQFCFLGFSRFLQYAAFPNKTLASFP